MCFVDKFIDLLEKKEIVTEIINEKKEIEPMLDEGPKVVKLKKGKKAKNKKWLATLGLVQNAL